MNAFLTFAATQHTYTPEHLQGRPRVAQILEAAKAGRVPVRLVSSKSTIRRLSLSLLEIPIFINVPLPPLDLSDKNPLVELPHDASVVALLAVFSTGTHRGTPASSWVLVASHTHTIIFQYSSNRHRAPPSHT